MRWTRELVLLHRARHSHSPSRLSWLGYATSVCASAARSMALFQRHSGLGFQQDRTSARSCLVHTRTRRALSKTLLQVCISALCKGMYMEPSLRSIDHHTLPTSSIHRTTPSTISSALYSPPATSCLPHSPRFPYRLPHGFPTIKPCPPRPLVL
jgi:hypothetical protein